METAADRRWKWRRVAILTAAAVVMAWLIWWAWAPSYIELDVPVPKHQSGLLDVWDTEERSEVAYTLPGSWGRDYVLRRVGQVHPDRHPWQSEEEIVEHFEAWLAAKGWTVQSIAQPEDRLIPGMVYLGEMHLGMREYTRPEDKWGKEGRIGLSVWPSRSGERVTSFYIVLTSKRSSLLRRLMRPDD
jgi:hypothetical protein